MEIIHDTKHTRFYSVVDGLESSIDYSILPDDPTTIDVYRTYVPEQLRGRKIAESLVEALFAFARKEHLKVLPSCSYVVLYFKRHKQHAELLSSKTDPESGGSCRIQ